MAHTTTGLSERRAEAFQKAVEQCAKCGKCRSVCPVFELTCDESNVARGRIELARLARAGQLKASARLTEAIRSCVQCMRCEAACPSGVDYESVLRGIREHLATDRGVPWVARLVFRAVLPRRGIFDAAIRFASLLESLIPLRRRGPLRHLPLFFLGSRWVPPMASRSVLDGGVRTRNITPPRMRVALFTGCLINYVYTDTARAIVDVLEHEGIEVVIPQGQVCCGAPVLSYGDMEAARRLAKTNLRVLTETQADAIVVACATGGRMLKNEYPFLLGGQWKSLGDHVYDWAEFAARFLNWNPNKLNLCATYHDPCHLRRGQRIEREPRALLAKTARFVEMAEPDMCCGYGGTFSLFHYEMASAIGQRKAENIAAAHAEVVATGCPGCMMHISDALAKRGTRVEVVHLAELMRRALLSSS